MFYEDVFRELGRSEVRYLIAGGVAVNLHGVPRMTYDLDVVIDLTPENIKKMFSSLAQLNFRPKNPVTGEDFSDERKRKDFIRDKGMRVLSFWQDGAPIRELDIFVENQVNFETLWHNKVVIDLGGGLKVPVVCVDHLIELKRFANRKQDIADIESLQKVKVINGEKKVERS